MQAYYYGTGGGYKDRSNSCKIVLKISLKREMKKLFIEKELINTKPRFFIESGLFLNGTTIRS